MDYLRGNATASATALFVICRHLSKIDGSQTQNELRDDLQPLRSQRSGDGDVLQTSLEIGSGLGIIRGGSGSAGWSVDPTIRVRLVDTSIDQWSWFRGELLYRINQQAMAAITGKERVPDLVLGIAWFLQQNPLTPFGTPWNGGAEAAAEELGLKAVERSEQWRPFLRWSLALGLARNVDTGRTKVSIPDASTAIADQFPWLPDSGRAHEWLGLLRKRLPIFGAPELLAELPQRRIPWQEVPPAVSLGLLKLEKAGAIALRSSDDAADIVTVGLGASSRQVGTITVTGAKL